MRVNTRIDFNLYLNKEKGEEVIFYQTGKQTFHVCGLPCGDGCLPFFSALS